MEVMVVPPRLLSRKTRARGWGKARAAERLGWTKIFFQSASPFPIPRSPLPQKLGTDPTIVNKIKGLRVFGGGAGVEAGWRWLRNFFKFPLDTPLRGGHEIVYNRVV